MLQHDHILLMASNVTVGVCSRILKLKVQVEQTYTGFISFSGDSKLFILSDHKVRSQSKCRGMSLPYKKQSVLFYTGSVGIGTDPL